MWERWLGCFVLGSGAALLLSGMVWGRVGQVGMGLVLMLAGGCLVVTTA